jgi:hypothetical protein
VIFTDIILIYVTWWDHHRETNFCHVLSDQVWNHNNICNIKDTNDTLSLCDTTNDKLFIFHIDTFRDWSHRITAHWITFDTFWHCCQCAWIVHHNISSINITCCTLTNNISWIESLAYYKNNEFVTCHIAFPVVESDGTK